VPRLIEPHAGPSVWCPWVIVRQTAATSVRPGRPGPSTLVVTGSAGQARPVPATDAPTTPDAPIRRRRWPWVVGALVLVLALAGGALAWIWGGKGADQASVGDALTRFRAAQARGDANPLQPAAGVYRYRGTGTESLSVLGARQSWGPVIPVTVTTTGPGCWTVRIDYSTNHRQELDYCERGTRLLELGGRTRQKFDFGAFAADDTQAFVCDPPGVAVQVAAQPGDSWKQSCTGGSTTQNTRVVSAGPNTFLGVRTLRIAGKPVEAYVYRTDRTLSGDQSGREHDEMWFAVETGLLVRYRRDSKVRSPSPVGDVTYRETGTMTATTLTPRR
jgi:hypothetical protein